MAYRVESNGVIVVRLEDLVRPLEDPCPECGLEGCSSWCPADAALEAEWDAQQAREGSGTGEEVSE